MAWRLDMTGNTGQPGVGYDTMSRFVRFAATSMRTFGRVPLKGLAALSSRVCINRALLCGLLLCGWGGMAFGQTPGDERQAESDLITTLFEQSLQNFATSSLPRTLPSRPEPDDRTSVVKRYDPITNLLFSVGADQTLTADLFARIQQALDMHFARSADATSSIAAFLSTGFDIHFGDFAINRRTLRLQLIDRLSQVSNADAISVLALELQATSDSSELTAIADALDNLAPGEYSGDILWAVSETLAMANEGLLANIDETALYAVVHTHKARLAQMKAQMNPPQVAAVPATVRPPARADDTSKQRPARKTKAQKRQQQVKDNYIKALITAARADGEDDVRMRVLQRLARFSAYNAAARGELLEQARANRIPEDFWPDIAVAVTRDATHPGGNNEIDSSGEDSRLTVISDLLDVVQPPSAIEALQDAATALAEEE